MEELTNVDVEAFKEEMDLENYIIKDLYSTFLQELIDEKERIRELYLNNELDKLTKILHNIKGISGNYKATYVFQKSGELENSLKSNDLEELDSKIAEILEVIAEAANEIKQYFKFGED